MGLVAPMRWMLGAMRHRLRSVAESLLVYAMAAVAMVLAAGWLTMLFVMIVVGVMFGLANDARTALRPPLSRALGGRFVSRVPDVVSEPEPASRPPTARQRPILTVVK